MLCMPYMTQCSVKSHEILTSNFHPSLYLYETSKKHFTLLQVKLMRGFTSNLITSNSRGEGREMGVFLCDKLDGKKVLNVKIGRQGF